MKTPKRS